MTIPVRVYHGRLNVSSIPMTKQMLERVAPSSLREGGNVDSSTMIMDFGSMEEEEVSFALLQIHNPNPVPVLVTDLISLEQGVEFAYLTQVRASDEGKVKSVGAAQVASRIGSAAAARMPTSSTLDLQCAGVSGRNVVVSGFNKSAHDIDTSRPVAHAAVALSAIANQASAEEVLAMESMLHGSQPGDWWRAVDEMTLQRCRIARKDWSWTCDMHATGELQKKKKEDEEEDTESDVHASMLLERALESAGMYGFCASDAGCHHLLVTDDLSTSSSSSSTSSSSSSSSSPTTRPVRGGEGPSNATRRGTFSSLRKLEWTTTARSFTHNSTRGGPSWSTRTVEAESVVYMAVRYQAPKIMPPMSLLPDKLRLNTGVMQQVSVALRFNKKKKKKSMSSSISSSSKENMQEKNRLTLTVGDIPTKSSSMPYPKLLRGYGWRRNVVASAYHLELYDQRVDVVLPVYMHSETEIAQELMPSSVPTGTTSDGK